MAKKKEKNPEVFKLTDENYYSREADRAYLSCSQFEDFLSCEAAAMAKIQGRYTPKKSEAFMVGNYFHTAFESEEAHEQFVEENHDIIYQKSGKKKRAAYEQAEKMIEAAMADPYIRGLVEADGENEKIMTGKLFGHYPWKIRLDKYIAKPVRRIVDWKTLASIRTLEWSQELHEKVSFVRNFRYLFRAAVYMEIEKQYTGEEKDPIFQLICISKQDPPDKESILLNHRQELDLQLDWVKEKIWRVHQVKELGATPKRCGKCAYCRATKKITHSLMFTELDPGHFPEREDEYAFDASVQG